MANLEITDVKIRKLYQEGRLRALVSVTFNDSLAVHDIKVIEGPERFFVAMPSRKEPSGTFRDIVHPINEEARHLFEDAVLAAYQKQLLVAQAEAEAALAAEEAEAEAAAATLTDLNAPEF